MSNTAICRTCGGSPGHHKPSILDPTGIGDPGHKVDGYVRPEPPTLPQSPPAGDELANILKLNYAEIAKNVKAGSGEFPKTIAQLNAYILAQIKELIGPNEYRGLVLYKDVRNKLRNQLRYKAQARFGAEKGTQDACQ